MLSNAAGEVYYHNPSTGETTWEVQQSRDLERGWRECLADDGYSVYYYNDVTGEATWEYPIAAFEMKDMVSDDASYSINIFS